MSLRHVNNNLDPIVNDPALQAENDHHVFYTWCLDVYDDDAGCYKKSISSPSLVIGSEDLSTRAFIPSISALQQDIFHKRFCHAGQTISDRLIKHHNITVIGIPDHDCVICATSKSSRAVTQ